jgi:hypothetical protein
MVGSMTVEEQNAKHTHDPIFLKANYPEIDGKITLADFKKYWKLLAIVTERDLCRGEDALDSEELTTDAVCDWCFKNFQGESYSPRGKVGPLIRALGLHHTSMSVGDCVEISGNIFICENHGWRLLK